MNLIYQSRFVVRKFVSYSKQYKHFTFSESDGVTREAFLSVTFCLPFCMKMDERLSASGTFAP